MHDFFLVHKEMEVHPFTSIVICTIANTTTFMNSLNLINKALL